jgi:sarcosine oxidase subunit alpha
MTAFRVEGAGRIDRARPLLFHFDDVEVRGFAGDTIASALLASGVNVVGRSFKYHRPRGVWGFGVEDPNSLVDIAAPVVGANAQATTTLAFDGMRVKSVNGRPNVARDRGRFIDLFARFMPAGFYYKTFMFPNWHLFEPSVRAMSGFGRVDADAELPRSAEQINRAVDVLVVGAGPAGLLAALRAAEAGRSVLLVEQGGTVGGSLLVRTAAIDGRDGVTWTAEMLQRLAERGATVMTRTTAFGVYDHGLVALNEKGQGGRPDRLWRIRPGHVVLATGAIERPLPFANNDLPGVRSAEAALAYLRHHGIATGRKVVVATNNGLAYETAEALAAAGVDVTLVDSRRDAGIVPKGYGLLTGRSVVAAEGRGEVAGVRLDDGSRLVADSVVVSGGFTPTVHLYCQARGKLVWDAVAAAFVPGGPLAGLSLAGAVTGAFDLAGVFASVGTALQPIGVAAGALPAVAAGQPYAIAAAWPKPGAEGRVFIDLQHDVTVKDVELAARENYTSVEHLKRYTALGMAGDQGKTSNLNGIALMAELTGRTIPEVGTTTYRPPFTPVPLSSLAGWRSGALFNPPRRLVLENVHRDAGASLREYGGWLRPAFYGDGPEAEAVAREARRAREAVALFDGSPLGKIEVCGPEAAAFVDFVYYNAMATLPVGRCRYGLMLAESGVVFDDGVLMRLDANRFVVSCSSSHVAAVQAHLEAWRQDRFDRKRLFIHNATPALATLTLSGPQARPLLETLDLGLALDDAALPHMAFASGAFDGVPVRVSRVSFTGDRSYELVIGSDRAEALWTRLMAAGTAFGITPLGTEALMVLRAEKGYIVIGKDSDGLTLPVDLGVTAPLRRKKGEFIGRRSLVSPEAQRPDRKQLVGLVVEDGEAPLVTGAHGVETRDGAKRSIGYVTSSYVSPGLGRPIALGLIERGASRHGEVIDIQHQRTVRQARIAAPCAFDPAGERLNG